jgi:branched-chain amino acid transport system substrate-binding protein
MPHTTKRGRVLALLAVASLLLGSAGCGSSAISEQGGDSPAPTTESTQSASSAPATETDEIRIGVLATLTGAFAALGQQGVDGVQIAVDEYGGKVSGREIKLFVESTDSTAASAIEKARTLVERDKVDIILGPLSGAEGSAIKDNAGEWPNTTIIVAGSAAENITMRGVPDNVWRTSYSGQQPTYGLGSYAAEQGFKKVAIVAEDYDFPYAQVGGFLLTYCAEGQGEVDKSFWVPVGTSDYSSIFPQISSDVDALFVALGGTDMVNFINQLTDAGTLKKGVTLLGGTVAVDASTLASSGEQLDGVMSGSIMSGDIDTPEFKALDKAYQEMRNEGAPSLFVENYYRAAKWALLAAEKVNGNVEDLTAYRDALQNTSFTAPASEVSFDEFHNVVTDTFLNQVQLIDGQWRNHVVKTFPKTSQFWTFDPVKFQENPAFGRDYPKDCSVVRAAQ